MVNIEGKKVKMFVNSSSPWWESYPLLLSRGSFYVSSWHAQRTGRKSGLKTKRVCDCLERVTRWPLAARRSPTQRDIWKQRIREWTEHNASHRTPKKNRNLKQRYPFLRPTLNSEWWNCWLLRESSPAGNITTCRWLPCVSATSTSPVWNIRTST